MCVPYENQKFLKDILGSMQIGLLDHHLDVTSSNNHQLSLMATNKKKLLTWKLNVIITVWLPRF